MRDTSGWYLPCAPSDWPDDKYYDPRELYNLEGRNNDRKFLPHVALREANTLAQILLFLRRFGPLKKSYPSYITPLDGETDEEATTAVGMAGVNLDDFARRQRHYAGVMRLWDVLNEPELLKDEWRNFLNNREGSFSGQIEWFWSWVSIAQANRSQIFWVGDYTESSANVENRVDASLVDRAMQLPAEQFHEVTVKFVSFQLDLHGTGKFLWRLNLDASGTASFRPDVRTDSLWAAVWEFFALDTGAGRIWRVCPHCRKLFHPTRRDRLFCTPRQQQLYSKRRYWNKRQQQSKAGEREKMQAREEKP